MRSSLCATLAALVSQVAALQQAIGALVADVAAIRHDTAALRQDVSEVLRRAACMAEICSALPAAVATTECNIWSAQTPARHRDVEYRMELPAPSWWPAA